MNNYFNLIKKIKYICSCDYKYFLNKKNVLGIGIGYKTIKGFKTFKLSIRVLVKNKLPLNKLSINNIIPENYKGISTDVIKSSNITSCGFTNRIRPVIGGYSISPNCMVTRGTFGCLVTDGHYNYILGSNHVLADENTLPIGTKIVQPGISDGGDPSHDVIANLSHYIKLKPIKGKKEPENFVDCAICKLVKKSIASSKIALIDNLNGYKEGILESEVRKSGSSSGLTLGLITLLDGYIEVNLEGGKYIFCDLIGTTKMSEKGDSGAILVDEKNYALGMLLGSNETTSFYTPIKTVLENLKVNLITK